MGTRLSPAVGAGGMVGQVAPVDIDQYSLCIPKADPRYFHFLYGNRSAYDALADILADAEQQRTTVTTATIVIEVGKTKRTGVVNGEDIVNGFTGLINLTRVASSIMGDIADLYQSAAQAANIKLTKSDWKKPIRFMPLLPGVLDQVFELLGCQVLVHPVYLKHFDLPPQDNHIHYIASFRKDAGLIVEAEPNLYEPGPHPSKITF